MKTFKKELKALKKQLSEPKRQTNQARQRTASDINAEEETFSFTDAMQGVTPLSQDKIEPDKQVELFKKY